VAFELFSTAGLNFLLAGASIAALSSTAWMYSRKSKLQAELKASRDDKVSVLENLTEGYYRCSLDGQMQYANPALVRLCAFNSPSEFLTAVNGRHFAFYADPQRRAEFSRLLQSDGAVMGFTSQVYRHKAGDLIWITENARVVRDPKSGAAVGYEGTVSDTTDNVLRMEAKDRLIKLTSHVPGGLFQLERNGTGGFEVVFSSPGFRELLDWKSGDQRFDLQRFLSIIHPDDLTSYHASLKASRKLMQQWVHEFRVVTDGGKAKWMKVQATPELQIDGRIVWHGYLQDVSGSKADEAQFRSLAYNDTLTQLPNRRLLLERLQHTIASCARRNECAAVLFIDLDNFKLLNDTHGHETGDLLLIEIAKRLKRLVRRNDTVARLAGDEFVVLLEGLGRDKAAANQKVALVAEKFLAAFARNFDLGRVTANISASIGAISFDGSAKSVDDILKHADTAMYEVKNSGRNAYRIFEQGRDVESGSKLMIGEDLKQVVKKKQLVLRLQPQVDRDGLIVGAEALIRWNHPTLGMLTPDKFMGLAEQRGQAREIGQFVLEHGVKLLSAWQANPSTASLKLAVNISAQQFLNEDFVSEIRTLINRHKIMPSRLTLELTEQVISKDRENAVKAMERLKTTGIRLSLDDFGTGLSSLSHLKDMPLDEVKIDGKFVKLMQDRPKDMALVKTIIAMAEALGLTTVAEHVETQAQEKFLLDHGCDAFQGYLYSGAMTRDDFEEAVKRNSMAAGQSLKLANVA
jgi:diguanylate cyclase (GGDEF)-like protein